MITIKNNYIQKIPNITAYISTLYFIEIIRMMFSMVLNYNKLLIVLFVLIVAVLLTIHIIRLYLRKKNNRIIHLILIDIHLALSVVFIYNFISDQVEMVPIIFFINSILLVISEIPLLFLLTKQEVVNLFKYTITNRFCPIQHM